MSKSNLTLSQRIARAAGTIECEKIMSLHVYWHAAGIHREEFEQYWSKREDITWAHGFGQWSTRWTYFQNYVLGQEIDTFINFRKVISKYPQVKKVENYRKINECANHYTTSPIIEVAGDGMSAKGLFYTPGYIGSFINDHGKVEMFTLSERYGADFIYEDGKWVYLNLRVCPDISGEIGGGGYGEPREEIPGEEPPPPPQRAADSIGAPAEIPGPIYLNWSVTQVPQKMPPLPMPFRTQSDTFLYSDVTAVAED